MGIDRLRKCVADFTRLAERDGAEVAMLSGGKEILARLIKHDDWLPEFVSAPDQKSYRQYLLHCDPLERFSIVSFVWGPGQSTPIHNHTVWGLIGVLRGEEHSRRFDMQADGSLVATDWEKMVPGDIDVVSPNHGDIHQVANGLPDRPSISIHVYGADIGAVTRHVFDPQTGAPKAFISGYSNTAVPNLWHRA